MKNEQSVFPSQYDPLIFFADADLDNFTTYQQYYTLYNADQYTQASNLLNNSDVDFYGAWLLNLIENELYAIESNMDSFVIPEDKPRLISHGLDDPTEEFSHWVYYNKYPNIPEAPPPPPEPAPPTVESNKWFNSPGVCPIDTDGWSPKFEDSEDGLYFCMDEHISDNIGINAPEVFRVSDVVRQIPLYDANDNITTYTLRNVLEDLNRGKFGFKLYNNDILIQDLSVNVGQWMRPEYYDSVNYYCCFGADTVNFYNRSTRTYELLNNVIWFYLIMFVTATQDDELLSGAIYLGFAIDLDTISQYAGTQLYLGSDWFTPAN